MLHKTRGIVFKTTDYSETSVIAQVFTEKFGNQSYLINGVKRPSAKIKLNILQPLYLLDMVVYHKPAGQLQRVAELRHLPVFQTIPYDIVKSSIALFLDEVISKAIRHQAPDEPLFNFLFHAIELLDSAISGMANFHLVFLVKLSRYLGFAPGRAEGFETIFDLRNGEYLSQLPGHPHVLQGESTTYWKQLSSISFEELDFLHIPPAERKYLLNKILEYYRLHLDNFGEVKSVGVLGEVLG